MTPPLPAVAILAGGIATRLRPLTEKVPKALLPVAGKPFVAHQLELLKRNGIRRVVLCIGHLGEMVRETVGDGAAFGLNVEYSFDGDKLLGTGGALKRAAVKLGESFFILYGDSYLDIDYQAVAAAFRASGRTGLMTVCRNEDKWDRSNVLFRDSQIVKYSKRAAPPGAQHIDFGLGLLKTAALELVPRDEPYDLALLYEQLVSAGQLAGYEVHQRFYEIGSLAGLRETEEYLLQKERKGVTP